MPVSKNALIRYKTIDRCLQNHYRRWTLEDLIEECSKALYEYEGRDEGVSRRTVQLDIQMMRSDKLGYNAPIKVLDNGDGTYTVDDILGGFYCYGRYPSYLGVMDFFADAVFHLEGDAVVLDEVGSWYFDQYPITIVEGIYDAASETFTLDLDFDGDPFYVQLVGIQLTN